MQSTAYTGRSRTDGSLGPKSAGPKRTAGLLGFVRRSEAWLDRQGKGAWIAAMVAGFILFWPVGLALLAYMIWGKKMFAQPCSTRFDRHDQRHDQRWGHAGQTTGNLAFDTYKAEALYRLEDEQAAFEAFLERLRSSKDKTEFDTFMEDRARGQAMAGDAGTDAAGTEGAADLAASNPTRDSRPGEY